MHENYLKIIQAKTLAFRSGLTFGSAMILIVEIPLVVWRKMEKNGERKMEKKLSKMESNGERKIR